jgi:hypothetical protein
MLIQESSPRMDFVVLDRHSWAYAKVKKFMLTRFQDFIDASKRIVQVVRIASALFVKDSVVVDDAEGARCWLPWDKRSEQRCRGHVMTVRHQPPLRRANARCVASCRPAAQRGATVKPTVENSDTEIRIDRIPVGQWSWFEFGRGN